MIAALANGPSPWGRWGRRPAAAGELAGVTATRCARTVAVPPRQLGTEASAHSFGESLAKASLKSCLTVRCRGGS